MKLSRRALVVLAIIAVVITVAGFRLFSPLRANYGTVQTRHLVQEVFGTGTVEARVLVTAGSKITGRVRKVLVDQGDFVKKGQLLAVLESEDLLALTSQAEDAGRKAASMQSASENDLARAGESLRAADASLQKSEATLRLAGQTLDRYKELFNKGIVSGQDLDEKQTAYDEAARQRDSLKAGKAAAEADMKRLKDELDAARHETSAGKASVNYAKAKLGDSFVRSSLDGVVVSRDAEAGDAVVAGSPIFHIADPDTVWVKANIDEAQGGGISVGDPAKVYLRTSRHTALPGTVARVAQESDRVTEEMEVDVSFPLKDKGSLHLGEQAEVYVRGMEKDCLSVPVAAVTVRDGREGVFTVSDGRARFIPVETGVWTDGFVETSGLDKGVRVILLDDRLGAKLEDGARVKLAGPVSKDGGR